MQAHHLHIKVAGLNTHSNGNGITGIPSAVEMGNKNKDIWEIKTRKNVRKLSQLTISHFSNANFRTL